MTQSDQSVSKKMPVVISSSLFIFFALFFLIPSVSHAQVTPGDSGNFITTWNTENPGISASNQITIPGAGSGYNYHVYWVNTASSTQTGTTTTISNSLTLTFPEPGIYQVEITGDFPRIYFNNGGDRQKILTVEQWGNIVWGAVDGAFYGASNLRVPATDAPNLTAVSSMLRMFRNAIVFNDPINHWDVSNVTGFQEVLQNTAFNQPLNNWNVSSGQLFNNIFSGSAFNQPIEAWDVSSATNMVYMFNGTPFNQPLNNWNVSNVTNISRMFQNTPFNHPLDEWDTSSVQTFNWTFANAENFNQDLSSWNISSTTNMLNIFENAGLTQPNLDTTLSSWAQQAVANNIENISLHIGLKSYSSTGETALNTLRDLGWTITEQYQAEYSPSIRGTLIGTGTQSPLNNGSTTTAVEIRPDRRCTFQSWSDGNTDNPRTDTMTDNLSVSAIIDCASSGGGTSLATRIANLERTGNQAEADRLKVEYGLSTTTTETTVTNTPATLEDALASVRSFLDRPLPTDPESRSKTKELLSLLLELVKTLSQLMVMDAVSTGGNE